MRLFGKSDNLDSIKCKKCGTEFPDPERFERHKDKAHGKMKEKCRACGAEFYTSEELRKHKKKCK